MATTLAGDQIVDLKYDVVGIGNALVDVLAQVDEGFLIDNGLQKGSMELIEADRAVEIHSRLVASRWASGGSAANTMCGLASLGARVAYIGKVGDDELGVSFSDDLDQAGVDFAGGTSSGPLPTGRCVVVVTPDAERTMSTCLGISSLLGVDDLDHGVVAAGQVLYMEGYLFDRPEAKEAFRSAARIAHRHGRTVALTLSDSFCVDRHRADFRALVADDVDLLFANEHEIMSLFEVDSFQEAIQAAREHCELAVVTAGVNGSYVVSRDAVTHVPAEQIRHVVDTTGAGDLFAAGFLHGLTKGAPVAQCARLGSLAAGLVIGHLGPRPTIPLRGYVVDHPEVGHLVTL